MGIEALIRALDKYLITTYPRFVESLLKDAMSRSPHLVFAIALKYDMPQIADDAALETLRRPLFFAEGYTDTRRLFTIISRERFTRLMRYHFECVSEDCTVLRGMEVTTNPPESSTPCSKHLPCVLYIPTTAPADSESAEAWTNSCRCARQTGMEHAASGTRSFTVPVWVVNFMRKCRTLLSERPHWETLTKEGVDNQLMAPFYQEAARCTWCRRRAQEELPRLRERIVALIKEGIISVRVLSFLASIVKLIPCAMYVSLDPSRESSHRVVPEIALSLRARYCAALY